MPYTSVLMPSALIAFFLISPVISDRAESVSSPKPKAIGRDSYLKLAKEADENLHSHVLSKWFPRSIDRKAGGFNQNFNEDWSAGPGADRSVVYQARLTWTSAVAARRYPKERSLFLEATQHGVKCLRDVMWDKQFGGFFFVVVPGNPTLTDKHAYGNSFGMYAAAASYETTHDPQALDLAQRAFRWLETHAHDSVNGGYFEAFTGAGLPVIGPDDPPLARPFVRRTGKDQIGTPYGQKTMNTHIHLLEALTELHAVWPDPKVTERLQEVHNIIRDKVIHPDGYQYMYFKPNWTPTAKEDSYGHDIETAYLLVESSAELGHPKDRRDWTLAKSIVDHTLKVAEDRVNGGIFDSGTPAGEIAKPMGERKVWWVQAEALNSLLLMHQKYGKTSPRYWEAFLREWRFILKSQVDHTHGGWYPYLTKEGKPMPGAVKSDGWTESYHQGRALMNVADRLRALANAK